MKHFPGGPLLFLLLKGSSLAGLVIIQAQSSNSPPPPPPPPPRWVNGLLSGSVLLPVDKTPEQHIQDIEWFFGAVQRLSIGRFKNGTFEEFRYTDRFHHRVKMFNETTLRVDGLQMEDAGTFQALIRFTTGYLVTQDFHLSVYEPVPVPVIRTVSPSSDGGNVTLECEVGAQPPVNITWKAGTVATNLEDLHHHQLITNRSILNISLNCSIEDRSFFCVASNPVDMKNVSISTSSICLKKDKTSRSYILLYVLLPVLIALVILALLILFYWKRTKRKSKASTFSNTVLESSSGVEYTEIRRIPPEGNDQTHVNLETTPIELKQQPRRVQTVYDEIRHVPKEVI